MIPLYQLLPCVIEAGILFFLYRMLFHYKRTEFGRVHSAIASFIFVGLVWSFFTLLDSYPESEITTQRIVSAIPSRY